uniref:ABC transporter substrate-binding protein n=1 Tax=Pseudomonas sp. TaxID=306 RepID=UPI00261091BB
LIHGAASTVQTTFGRLIPELSKTHHIIGVELQAHGHSDNRDGRPISFEQDAADVVELLQQLQPDLILVGSDQSVLQPRLNAIAPTEIFETRDHGTPIEQVAQLTVDVATRIQRLAAGERYLANAWQTFAEAHRRCAHLNIAPLQVISVIDERRALVFGQGSLFDDVLVRLGLRNAWLTATNGWGYATIGFEQLAEQPDAQLVYFNAAPGLEPRLANNPLWRNLPSVRSGHAIKLPEVLFYGGMPSAVSFARLLAAQLPEVNRG